MTTKHLDGYYPGGYTLSARYSKLVIDKTADVRGSGVTAPYFATVVNRGAIYGSTQGVYLEGGGSLINGSEAEADASISGVTRSTMRISFAFGSCFGGAVWRPSTSESRISKSALAIVATRAASRSLSP